MLAEHMLSTTDNPYSPFTEFDQWFAYDSQVGHHTLAYLARITRSSDELSELDQSQAIDMAMDEIIAEDVFNIYVKVPEPTTE